MQTRVDPLRPIIDLSAAPPRVIGVLSDSHVPFRLAALPQAALDLLRGCDLILHAGDLEDIGLIDQLARIAPVYTVRGISTGRIAPAPMTSTSPKPSPSSLARAPCG